MSDISENVSLPAGWDTKYDFKTGKRYYINYITKHTSLEDPRIKYKKLVSGDSFQSFQSSPIRSYSPQPFYHMHQDINFSSGRPSPIMGRSYSPLMGSNAIHYLAQKPHEYPTIETSIAKIKALFPTVGETHIKTLLHKYHYREAVVVSALQVEKHPLTTPGPYSSPLQAARHVISQIAPSVPGSPGRFSFSSAFRNLSPRRTPHSSPKMKLRYLKSVFPVVDETVILDTLCSSENNVHKASETLMTMGFMRKSSELPYKLPSIKKHEEESFLSEKELKNDSIYIPLRDPLSKSKSCEEKAKMKKRLEAKFESLAERVIVLALETAEYDEERAEQFLKSTLIEGKAIAAEVTPIERDANDVAVNYSDNVDSVEKSFRDSGIWEKTSPDLSENKSTEESSDCSSSDPNETKNNCDTDSANLSMIADNKDEEVDLQPKANVNFQDRQTILVSKTGIKLCQKILPRGANKALLNTTRCTPKGPCKTLAKGSIFSIKKNLTNQSATKNVQKGECVIF